MYHNFNDNLSSGEPAAPPPAPQIVVGAEAVARQPQQPQQDNFVVGHTGDNRIENDYSRINVNGSTIPT